MNYYGQIDMTRLGMMYRQHPELFKKVTFKDGEHLLLDVNIYDRREPDSHGNVSFMKAAVKKDDERQGVNYFVGDFKLSKYQPQPQQQYTATAPQPVMQQAVAAPANFPGSNPQPAPVQQAEAPLNDLPF